MRCGIRIGSGKTWKAASFAGFFLLGSCSFRPPQKSFFLYTSPAMPTSIESIAAGTAADLNLKSSRANFSTGPGDAVAEKFELHGHGYSLFISSAADQQCYTANGPIHITYNKGYYDVIVARTGLISNKSMFDEMPKSLAKNATKHGGRLADRGLDCPKLD